MEKKTIGRFIAILRKSNGMTQQELADRLNVSNKTVSKWECDDGYPELTLIPVIAEIFDVSSDEILQGCRISKNEPSERNNVKTDKQVNRLVERSINKFKTVSLISGAISLCGFVLLLAIAYGAFRPYIGLGILAVFLVGSFILETINKFSTKTAINSSELLDKNDIRMINCDELIRKYFFFVIMINIAFLIIGLLLGLLGDAHSVIVINILIVYMVYLIPFLFVSYIIFQIREQRRFKSEINSNKKVKSNLKKLNISFWIVNTIPLLIILVLFALGERGDLGVLMVVLSLILCISYLSLRKRILKGYLSLNNKM